MLNLNSLYTPKTDSIQWIVEDKISYKVTTDCYGVVTWTCNGLIDRKSGPAIIHPTGQSYWYKEGSLHNENGPAVIQKGGTFWYINGKLHRVGGPAILYSNGYKEWYQNGLLHREDGPAIERENQKLWYHKGVLKKIKKGHVRDLTMAPKTQKARSILYGCAELQEEATYIYSLRGYGSKSLVLNEPILITCSEDIKKLNAAFWAGKKIFARPCPKTPKHGFVDSRVISSNKELRALLKEVLAVDPKGEIVLTSFLDQAVCNAVLTTGGTLSIGPGHNGATAGKNSFSFPIKPEELSKSVRKRSGVIKYDNSFIESVFTRPESWVESFYFTQVRGGPAINATKDFIPKKIMVKKIVQPNDDLVAWEKEVKKFPVGTVVYGSGHTLASHAAIHCVINNIPFITSFNPKVGEILTPSLDNKVVFSQKDFKVGFTQGIDSNIEMCKMLHMGAAILHNWAYLRTSEHASWLLGLGVAYFLKVLCCLNFGEYRYADKSKDLSRDTVYQNLLNSSHFASYIRKCPTVAADFNSSMFKSGFGGVKWAKAAYMCVDMWNVVAQAFNGNFTQGTANRLVKMLNKSVNLVHNNGWLFNKISDQLLLDYIANHSGLALLQLSDIIYINYNARPKLRRIRQVNKVVYSK